MNKPSKVIVIGLDGGTFRVLRPLIDAGIMPTLGRMMREGASGSLFTTRPPVTCPAWPTMFTGVNPGRHGVFSFSYRDQLTRSVRTASGNDIRADKLWDIAGEQGKRVAILNVPITFPATQVNGVMLTGFVSPDESPNVFWPHTFGADLRGEFDKLFLNWAVLGHRPSEIDRREAHIRRINDLMVHRCRKFEWITAREDFDFCFLVHEYTDRINHLFYHIIDREFDAHRDPRNAGALDLLKEGHRMLDESIGQFVARFKDANFLFVSDHGFDGVKRWVYVNNLLEAHGLTRLHPFRTWADVITRHLNMPTSIRERLGVEQRGVVWHKLDPARLPLIDYPRSKGYAGPQLEHAVYVNVAGREPQGTVQPGKDYERVRQKIVDVLSSATDPETGGRVFEGVWTREELYHGPYVENAPDIIYELSRGYMVSNAILPPRLLQGGFLRPLRAGWDISGYHRPEGIFIGWGPAFNVCNIGSANILDIAPTVLYLLGLGIPSYMDGRLMESAIREDWLRENVPLLSDRELTSGASNQPVYTHDEQMEVTRRLEELGYL